MERPLTIVIPVYNEGANFPALWAEMTSTSTFPLPRLSPTTLMETTPFRWPSTLLTRARLA